MSSRRSLRVLVLEDQPTDAALVLDELRQFGFEPEWRRVETQADYLANLHENLDVILADYSLPQFNALQALHGLQQSGLDIPFIVVTGSISEEVAVECMKQGAADYLLKDRLTRLGPVVVKALEDKRLRVEKQRAEAALRASQELLQRTFTSLHDAVFIVDASTGEIVDSNRAAAEIFGYSRDEMLGRATNFLHLDDAALQWFRESLNRAVAEKGFLFLEEFKMRRKDGTVFPTEHSVVPVKNEQGQRIFWVSVVRDITGRQRAEEALRESERFAHSTLDGLSAHIAILDEAGTILAVNRSWRAFAEENPPVAANASERPFETGYTPPLTSSCRQKGAVLPLPLLAGGRLGIGVQGLLK